MGKVSTVGVWERVKGSGFWYARYKIKGKLYREPAGTITQARKLYSFRMNEGSQGRLPEFLRTTKKITFGDLIPDVLAHCTREKYKSVTDVKERMKVLGVLFGNLPIGEITPAIIEEKLATIATEREWKPATRNRYKALLSLTFRLAIKNGRATVNTARMVPMLKENNTKDRQLSQDEEKRLRAAVEPGHPERWALVQLSIMTGMRAGEQWGLKWSDVDRSTKLITLLETKNGSTRHVPLNDTALDALDTLKKHDEGTGFVCPREPYRYWFSAAMIAAGIKDYTWHCNRHTTGSRATMAGVDLLTVAQFLGHKNLQTTKRYGHLTPGHMSEAAKKLGEFGSNQPVSTEPSQLNEQVSGHA